MMYEEFVDDAAFAELPVRIAGQRYLLREASGDAAVKFNNARNRCYEYEAGKLKKVLDAGNLEPYFVSLCLFHEDGSPVDEKLVRSWPSRTQTNLFNKAKELSRIDAQEDVEVLEKQLVELQNRIAELRKNGEGTSKN